MLLRDHMVRGNGCLTDASHRARHACVQVLVACTLMFGCSSSSRNSTGTGDHADGGPPLITDGGEMARLAFSACPLLTYPSWSPPPAGPPAFDRGSAGTASALAHWLLIGHGSGSDGLVSAMAECATTKMPAVWSDPHGDTIDVFVKRYPAAEQPADGQLWLLEGGPGYAGTGFEPLVFLFAATIPTIDVYILHHRGTGNSTFASCPGGSSPEACAAAVPHLDGLTTTDAARDLVALIDGTRTPGQQVFVLGVSYGTYWAQRYLQVRPEQPTGVILDSTVPIGMDMSNLDVNFDNNAHAVLDLCKSDATCSTKLGPDPLAKAEQAIAAVTTGACGNGVQFLSFLGSTYFERLLLPASIYRILRCEDGDKEWLGKVGAYVAWLNGLPFLGRRSDVVFNNIVLSELWATTATAADLGARGDAMLLNYGLAPDLARIAETWPTYPHDAYYGKWPSSNAPVLVLQGTLDPRTLYGDVVKAHYSGDNQHVVEFPNAQHGVVGALASPMADPRAQGCGWQVTRSFLVDPTRLPETSCIAGMAPLDFGNPPVEWLALIGVQDLWENP